ncbi:MAG: glycosyl hydrolase family 65 protein [Solirubrobacteraceae bacterium]
MERRSRRRAPECGVSQHIPRWFGHDIELDLREDLEHSIRDGLHIVSSPAPGWARLRIGGMRDHDGRLSFAPGLPPALERVPFRLVFRGRRLLVEVKVEQARYALLGGEPLELLHHGECFTVTARTPLACQMPPPQRAAPSQPKGREPGAKPSRAMIR